MLIHDILGLDRKDNIYFIEESYAALRNNALTMQYLGNIARDPDANLDGIKDENGKIIGFVLHSPEDEESEPFLAFFANIIPSHDRRTATFSDITKQLKIQKIYNVKFSEFLAAVREYFSNELVNRHSCENCHIPKEPYDMVYFKRRNDRLNRILGNYHLRGEILEICCGNGMSTLPLRKAGYNPLAIDNDKCQVCQGLEHQALEPRKTIILDATRLSEFLTGDMYDTVVGFMLGTIYPFNKDIWENMMIESTRLLKHGGMVLFTVNKKEEIEILKNALEMSGIRGQIKDNTDDLGIYDQWIYVGTKNAP